VLGAGRWWAVRHRAGGRPTSARRWRRGLPCLRGLSAAPIGLPPWGVGGAPWLWPWRPRDAGRGGVGRIRVRVLLGYWIAARTFCLPSTGLRVVCSGERILSLVRWFARDLGSHWGQRYSSWPLAAPNSGHEVACDCCASRKRSEKCSQAKRTGWGWHGVGREAAVAWLQAPGFRRAAALRRGAQRGSRRQAPPLGKTLEQDGYSMSLTSSRPRTRWLGVGKPRLPERKLADRGPRVNDPCPNRSASELAWSSSSFPACHGGRLHPEALAHYWHADLRRRRVPRGPRDHRRPPDRWRSTIARPPRGTASLRGAVDGRRR